MKKFFLNYLSTLLFLFITYFSFLNIQFYKNFLINDYSFTFNFFILNTLTIYNSLIIGYIILLIPYYIFNKENSKARIILNHLFQKMIYFFKKKNNKKLISIIQLAVVGLLIYSFIWIKNNTFLEVNRYIGISILLTPIFLLYGFIKYIKYEIKFEEKMAILAWIVKIFFAPLMIVWFTGQLFTMINNMYLSYNELSIIKDSFYLFFQKHLFWLSMSIILFIDLIFFTIGYLVEIPRLKNKIKSVEPTFFGWFVVLICYPPFNTYTTSIINWYSNDFPKFGNEYIHIGLNIGILVFMGIYAWASFALGFKASNLTNRGIVKKGPYKYVRHPAYFTKNMAWWIGGMPLLIGNIQSGQYRHFFIVFFSLCTWTFIYYLRAITEERHLSLDSDYVKYKKEVKYKFVPKVF